MRDVKLKTGFGKESDSRLAVGSSFIVTNMTGNVFFPNLPGVPEVASATTAFTKALEDAKCVHRKRG